MMTTIIVVLSCLVMVVALVVLGRKGRTYSLGDLHLPIGSLLKRGYDGGFLVIRPRRSKVFVQFRKRIRSKGDYGIELSFPDATWSGSFFREFQSYCDRRQINYRIVHEGAEDAMRFLFVDLGHDVRQAASLAQHIFISIFSMPPATRYFVELENACLWDELIDDPASKPDGTKDTLQRSIAHIRKAHKDARF